MKGFATTGLAIALALTLLPQEAAAQSTWQVIQNDILNPNCAGCHSEGTSFARQSGLILTEDVAYEQLLDVQPKNDAAKADNLLRVSSEGLAGVYKSFLYEKINAPDQEHFYADHPYYGALMPLGAEPLTNGQIEFIRSWIVAGAPKDGDVVNKSILDDTTRYTQPAFSPLAVPDFGLQMHLPQFDVGRNSEREVFYYKNLNNSDDIFIKRVEVSMRPGSHHFILYKFDDSIPRSLRPRANSIRDLRSGSTYNPITLAQMGYHDFVSGTQWPLLNYHFPEGVALRLPAGTGLDLNSHYANRSGDNIKGEVYTNFHYANPNEITHVAEILDLNNTSIKLPANKVTTISRTYRFGGTISIFQLFSHAHELMTEFKVVVDGGSRAGELVYVSYDWEHPPILELDPPLVLEDGQGLRLDVTYNNTRSRTVEFGLLSTDEMMILFGYYFQGRPTSVTLGDSPLPAEFSLRQNYPNPFNPTTTIAIDLAETADVSLNVYDALGREVARLMQGTQPAGTYKLTWNAGGLPSGMYFARLQAGNRTMVKKMMLMR